MLKQKFWSEAENREWDWGEMLETDCLFWIRYIYSFKLPASPSHGQFLLAKFWCKLLTSHQVMFPTSHSWCFPTVMNSPSVAHVQFFYNYIFLLRHRSAVSKLCSAWRANSSGERFLAGVSNLQRGWSCKQIFDSSMTFFNPPLSEQTHCMENGQLFVFFSCKFLFCFWKVESLKRIQTNLHCDGTILPS